MHEQTNDLENDQLRHQQHSVEALEIAIGKQVRSSRKRLNLTVAALAKQAHARGGHAKETRDMISELDSLRARATTEQAALIESEYDA